MQKRLAELGTLFDIVPACLGVNLIMGIRGDEEYGDISVKKHMTPSLDLEATSTANLISWKYEECFTNIPCQTRKDEIEGL